MTISADLVKELREKTGAGMMDCKRALSECNGNAEKALESLRKQGLAIAAKKASRAAAEGLIGVVHSGNTTTLVEVNCETDFVCKTEDFQNYVKKISEHVAKGNFNSVDDLLSSSFEGKLVKDVQTALVAKIGENIGVRRFFKKTSDKFACYVHAGSKICSYVAFDDPNNKLSKELAHEVAMHVAAMNPQYIRKADIPESFIAKEKEIAFAQMANEKKPPEMMEKIVAGKVNKYLSEICLDDQIFVKDPLGKSTVAQTLKNVDPTVKIKEFVRVQVGEGVEKKQ